MRFFKRPRTVRRYSSYEYDGGYMRAPYEDITLMMDVQTMENKSATAEDGARAGQMLKTFCDSPVVAGDGHGGARGDRLWFDGKWFECTSSRLSENTPLRHWTSTFAECPVQEDPPGAGSGGAGDGP